MHLYPKPFNAIKNICIDKSPITIFFSAQVREGVGFLQRCPPRVTGFLLFVLVFMIFALLPFLLSH